MLQGNAPAFETYDVLGIPISVTSLDLASQAIRVWAKDAVGRYVCVRDVHGIMQARRDLALKAIHDAGAMVVPDGMPLVWLGRRAGHAVERTCGADLMDVVISSSTPAGLRHYFYGGKPGVAETLKRRFEARAPGVAVVGVESPPFHELTTTEIQALADRILSSGAHVVWVGLSSPKQEFLMRRLVDLLPATLVGVGAAFDFHSGAVPRAPLWMQRRGLEWLHRLSKEPRRLWRRYLLFAPQFALLAAWQEVRRTFMIADRRLTQPSTSATAALKQADTSQLSGSDTEEQRADVIESTRDYTARVAVVLASYNRKDTTLRCLESLRQAGHPASHLTTILFDDASPDGTAGAARAAYPNTRVIDGDGRQFWCGGMRLAMAAAAEQPYDFLLWLNDDGQLAPGFLATLLAAHRRVSTMSPGPHVIVGALVDPQTAEITYSGLRRRSKCHPAQLERVRCNADRLEPCDTLNGNCVLFPASVVKTVGTIGAPYVHQLGDIDYGYRCVQAGARLWVAPQAVGTCARNERGQQWANPRLSFTERLRILNTPHGLPWRPWIYFMWRFGGPVAVAMLFVSYGKWLGYSVAESLHKRLT